MVGMKQHRFVCQVGRPAIHLQSSPAGLRRYLSSNSTSGPATSTRKQVTVVSDDGRVRWQDLTVREKAARTTQQTFNFGLVLSGFFLTVGPICHSKALIAHIMQGGVIYLLYSEVFSADSKTRHFNRAVDQVRRDDRALELLGSGHKIRAFGEPTSNKWARARPIA